MAYRARTCGRPPTPQLRARRRGTAGEHGAVTAETAMVLPLLVALTLALIWLLALAVGQVRTVDAAREGARALARDEPRSQALRVAEIAAPDNARVRLHDDGDTVRVEVRSDVGAPGDTLGRLLPEVTLHAEAVALAEGNP